MAPEMAPEEPLPAAPEPPKKGGKRRKRSAPGEGATPDPEWLVKGNHEGVAGIIVPLSPQAAPSPKKGRGRQTTK
jgi:hypothetical protein